MAEAWVIEAIWDRDNGGLQRPCSAETEAYLEGGQSRVPVIPVYGVELGGVVQLVVKLRMPFASVHHFLEGGIEIKE